MGRCATKRGVEERKILAASRTAAAIYGRVAGDMRYAGGHSKRVLCPGVKKVLAAPSLSLVTPRIVFRFACVGPGLVRVGQTVPPPLLRIL